MFLITFGDICSRLSTVFLWSALSRYYGGRSQRTEQLLQRRIVLPAPELKMDRGLKCIGRQIPEREINPVYHDVVAFVGSEHAVFHRTGDDRFRGLRQA